jgi:prepilin peptidase CpaA
MSPVWTIVFFLAALPFCVLCAAFDLTRMKIPNWVVLGLFACFLLLGPFALPLPSFGIRLLQTAIVLIIGFVLSTFFGIGGGDGKFAAAAAAFVAPGDYGVIMVSLGVMSLLAVALHRMMGRISVLQPVTRGWESYSDPSKFPFGLPLAATLVFYNLLKILHAF